MLSTSSLVFENNYALNSDVMGMPTKDVSVEFWARAPAYNKSSANADKKFEDLLNFATHLPDAEGRFSLLPVVALRRQATMKACIRVRYKTSLRSEKLHPLPF